MSDIVQRLRDADTTRRIGESYADVHDRRQRDRDEAAAEITRLRAEVERLVNGQHDVYAAAREEYRKKITEQAAQIEKLEAALRKINVGEGWAALIARAALAGAEKEESNG